MKGGRRKKNLYRERKGGIKKKPQMKAVENKNGDWGNPG